MSDLSHFRKAKDEFLAKDHHSPLTPQQRGSFGGLDYYPENCDLRYVLKIEEFPDRDKKETEIVTSTGESRSQVGWGSLSFSVDGETVSLTVYRGADGGEFFLPFGDTTNGKETYGAGRYLEVVPVDGGLHVLDFNYAYNPYCAYNPHWSCPIPPAENRLKVPLLAGERSFLGAEEH